MMPTQIAPPPLDAHLCFALHSASLAMDKLYKPHLDELGLTYPQYLALLALWEQDGPTVGALGERLFIDSGTLTPLLKRLEGLDLVARTRDSADERRVIVTLTTAGKRLRRKAAAIPERILDATGCGLPELTELTQRIQALRDRIVRARQVSSPHL